MKHTKLTVTNSLKVASDKHHNCATLLARSLYPLLKDAPWFTKELQLKFCAYFLQNLVDGSIEQDTDKDILKRVKKIPLSHALKLLTSNTPESGLKMLIALIFEELREKQSLNAEEQYVFYNSLFEQLFEIQPQKSNMAASTRFSHYDPALPGTSRAPRHPLSCDNMLTKA